jgi:hypothetical protein
MWRVEKLTSVDHHLTLIPWEYPGKLSEKLYLHRSMLKKNYSRSVLRSLWPEEGWGHSTLLINHRWY